MPLKNSQHSNGAINCFFFLVVPVTRIGYIFFVWCYNVAASGSVVDTKLLRKPIGCKEF